MTNPTQRRSIYVRLFLLPILFLVLSWPSVKPSLSQAKAEPVRTAIAPATEISPAILEIQAPPVVKTPVVAAAPTPPPVKPTTPAPVPVPSSQVRLNIAAIGVSIVLGQTGLDKSGHLMVPENPNHAAWYARGPKIGETGTALITGHLDSPAGPGVFFNLHKLSAGDEIRVNRKDGSVAVFTVARLASYAQDDSFPWSQVYSTTGSSALRIITCDGVYNPASGRYSRNLVVYASLSRIE